MTEIIEHKGKRYEKRPTPGVCEGCAFYSAVGRCDVMGYDNLKCTEWVPGRMKSQNFIFVEIK